MKKLSDWERKTGIDFLKKLELKKVTKFLILAVTMAITQFQSQHL